MTMTRATFLPSCALLLALPLASTFAETFEVEAGGDIQAAIDDASDGDAQDI